MMSLLKMLGRDMFSDKDLVARSIEDMAEEVADLQALARKEREKYEALRQMEIELRRKSVETRPVSDELAESFWQEAESLREESQELMRLLWSISCVRPRFSAA